MPRPSGRGAPASQLGPLVSKTQLDKVTRIVNEAVAAGARVLTGGRRPPSKPRGFYFEPTVLVVNPEQHVIWRTEVSPPSCRACPPAAQLCRRVCP